MSQCWPSSHGLWEACQTDYKASETLEPTGSFPWGIHRTPSKSWNLLLAFQVYPLQLHRMTSWLLRKKNHLIYFLRQPSQSQTVLWPSWLKSQWISLSLRREWTDSSRKAMQRHEKGDLGWGHNLALQLLSPAPRSLRLVWKIHCLPKWNHRNAWEGVVRKPLKSYGSLFFSAERV